MTKCFDIGTIQAFIDGELASGLSEKIIKHVALCGACATLLAETEEENALAFSILDEELNCLVPTERLRTKVFDSIRENERKTPFWQKLTGKLGFAEGFNFSEGFNFRSPSLAAFASVLLFVGAFAAILGVNFLENVPATSEVAVNTAPDASSLRVNEIIVPETPAQNDGSALSGEIAENSAGSPVIEAGSDSPENFEKSRTDFRQTRAARFRVQKADYTRTVAAPNNSRLSTGNNAADLSGTRSTSTSPAAASPNLAEEDGYLQTIATLRRSVDRSKEIVLRPTELVDYERDLAVVDDAIKKMKAEVRRNPSNQAAREVLRDSYKNKIDLLNSVAEKSEMIASIQ